MKKRKITLPNGKNSNAALTHYPTKDNKIHVIFAGTKTPKFIPKENRHMIDLSHGGSHGTLQLYLSKTRSGKKVAEIFREIPIEHRGKGIGTDLLKAAESVAKEHGIEILQARTKNPAAVKSYKKAGWDFVTEIPGVGFIYEKRIMVKE